MGMTNIDAEIKPLISIHENLEVLWLNDNLYLSSVVPTDRVFLRNSQLLIPARLFLI